MAPRQAITFVSGETLTVPVAVDVISPRRICASGAVRISRCSFCGSTHTEGDSAAARECRGRVAHFLTGVRGAAAMRGRIHGAESLSEIESILAQSLGE